MTNANTTTWWSAEGGAGKTTLASAQAVHLSRQGRDVALLDFNEAFPRIHKLFGVDRIDLVQVYDAIEKEDFNEGVLSRVMFKKHGVWILTGVTLSEFEQYKPEHFVEIIRAAKKMFTDVVIDVNSGLYFASTYAALKESDSIKMILQPSIYSLEDTLTAFNFVVDNWGVDKSKITAVLNKASNDDIDRESAKRILDIDVEEVRKNDNIDSAIKRGQLGQVASIVFGQEKNSSALPKALNVFSFLKKERRDAGVVNKSV